MIELNRELVDQVYKIFLKRNPENELVYEHHLKSKSVLEFIQSIIFSPEFSEKSSLIHEHLIYKGYDEEDLKLFLKFEDKNRAYRKGYFVNYFGSITNKKYLPKTVQALDEQVESMPVPMNFMAETAEYLGLLESINFAKKKFIGFELGAGWGPWTSLCGVLCDRIHIDYELLAVEADKKKIDFIKENLTENQLDLSKCKIIHGVVGERNEVIDFPVLRNSNDDYGSSIDKSKMNQLNNVIGYMPTQQYTIDSLILNYEKVDLLHIDIQGSEYIAISSSQDSIKKKVKYMVIGTHTRLIEGQLMDLLWHDWILVREKPCKFDRTKSLDAYLDGIQVWKNKNLS